MNVIDNDSVQKVKQRLDAIDLESVKQRLMRDEKWTREQADEVEPRYKGYLLLVATQPDHRVIPSVAIDKMWHTHILDTRKYAADCHSAFASFVHHVPTSKEEVAVEFQKTKALFREVLGFPMDVPNAQSGICQGAPDGGECFAGTTNTVKANASGICQGAPDDGECFAGVSGPAAKLNSSGICQGAPDGGECFAGVHNFATPQRQTPSL